MQIDNTASSCTTIASKTAHSQTQIRHRLKRGHSPQNHQSIVPTYGTLSLLKHNTLSKPRVQKCIMITLCASTKVLHLSQCEVTSLPERKLTCLNRIENSPRDDDNQHHSTCPPYSACQNEGTSTSNRFRNHWREVPCASIEKPNGSLSGLRTLDMFSKKGNI